MRLLIANRGEIALRIIRTATELGLGTVAVYAEDDADSPHVHAADEAIGLPGAGPAAYLDHAAILAAAKKSGAELIHPGYGFLSEQPEFARACASAGYTFVGPDAAALELFGNKSSARRAAAAAGVPVLPATDGPSSVEDIRAFAAAQDGAIVIKALAGGGGRGMRIVHSADQIDDAYRQCAAEAELGFGDPAVFAEAHLANARHIEVQIVAATPGQARALALGDRDCSIQRRYQKLIEIAPAQGISEALRRELHRAAARLCAQADYRGMATVEFLVTGEQFVFLEVNPRIQVEHTMTEEVTGRGPGGAAACVSPAARLFTSWGCLPASRRRRRSGRRAGRGARYRDSDPGQHGDAGRRRVGVPDRGHPDGVLAAERTRRAGRHLRRARD